MYLIIAGGGKVGTNLTRSLLRAGHEVTLIEQRPYRFDKLENEFEHQVIRGDATEMFVLERAGIKRPPDLLIAATGDDEDNIIICQLAREKYGVNNVIARINDPRNQPYFDLLGISPTVSATGAIMGLIEHEVPDHGLIHLLELRKENLEIVELTIDESANAHGQARRRAPAPEGARMISVVRDGKAEIPDEQTQLQTGDQVFAILEPGKEDELRRVLAAPLAPAVRRRRALRCAACAALRHPSSLPGSPPVAGRDLDRLGADAGDGRPHRPRAGRPAAGRARRRPARSCSRSASGRSGSRAGSRGASGAPGGSRSRSCRRRRSPTSPRASTSRRRRRT